MSAPDIGELAVLLRERYRIDDSYELRVEVSDAELGPQVSVAIGRPKRGRIPADEILLEVTHVDGGERHELWDRTVDATDALVGMLVESGYAYRDLPRGEGVEHEGAEFAVEVRYTRPELDRIADRMLGDN